ncbi:small RNA-binding protein 11, chloroplastic [Nicotiana tabacum]|uniref:Cold-inducible RNA-binding protein-like n=2 Tax=Nicotiana TaxID=4085 RepID=A0A1S4DLH2_TOBAC|nr:PREDICTED: cold-inducible RNA-binding protein [Nicotiana sylvestris]XP_016514246.1 PREDICTED: cold-inducible RNA-binding protein-like [Nicotiana tabacum]
MIMLMHKGLWPSNSSSAVLQPTFGLSRQSKFLKIQANFSGYPLASKIMVRNLPYSADESCLEKIFSNFGQVAEVKVVKDEVTQRSKGYAFIQYTSQENAMLALDNMDHKYLNGRVIFVEIAKPTKKDFGRYPKTCGPPEERLPSENEVPDLKENR